MKLKRVYIEISNICNLQCSFCSPVKRKPKVMSVEEFSFIASQVANFTDFIYLHVKGEPLFHPHLKEILQICQKNNLKVNITTNGTLLKNNEELLLTSSAIRQINISLHSSPDNKGYICYCVDFAKKLGEHKIFTELRLWNLQNNNNIQENNFTLEKIKDTFNIDINVCAAKSIKLADHTFLRFENEFLWPDLGNPYVSDIGYCHAVKHQIAILADGTVVPCCLDSNGVM
ncbi:MAG: radical SAM protein, partial [Oscillospiraceae bacterium]